MTHPVIFTDLDGTLLDSTYSFDAALPSLRLIRQRGIPLVICTSKTAAEIEYYREKLGNRDPFVSENGGGVFVPDGYFRLPVATRGLDEKTSAPVAIERARGYQVLRLGAPYQELRKAVKSLRQKGFEVRGFGDMSAEEVSELTGLSLAEARMAKEREFDEPFVVEGNGTRADDVATAVGSMGLHYTIGRIGHIMGDSDKGRAVSLLASLYRTDLGEVATIGVGDAPNDIPMLRAVDYPVIVQQPNGCYGVDPGLRHTMMAEGPGPAGWNRAIADLLARFR